MRFFPVLPAALCVAIAAGAPQPAWADTPVVIEGGDDDMRDAIRDLLPDRDAPTTLFEAERISEEAAQRAMVWLRSEGYYAAEVTPEATEDPPRARLVITPGVRFTFAPPELTYLDDTPAADADQAVRDALGRVEPDAAARAAAVLEAEANALTALQQAGYADAAAGERRVVVDHARNLVSAEFRFSAGARARLGDVRAEPDTILRPSYVASLRNWDEGDLFSPEALSRLRRDLSATGAVSRVTTRLEPADSEGVRDVVLEIEQARRNAYEFGAGYSTTEGIGFEAEWTRRNFTGRADALILAANIAETRQDISARHARPHAFDLGHTFTYGISAEREDIDAYTREGVSVFATVDASPRLRVGTSYGLDLSYDRYDDTASPLSEAVVLSAFYNSRHDTTGFSLDPHDGSIVEARIEPSVSAADETLAFTRLIAEGRVFESFGREDALTLAARIKTGWLIALAGDPDDVPPDRRFYAGGGGSVRGYDYNSIYPLERDLLGLTPGGQGLLEGSIEARWRFASNWGAVAFIDAGTAFDDWADAADLSVGVGVGVRYNLGFAPLRVDIAFPLDDEFATDDYALYISVGQAF